MTREEYERLKDGDLAWAAIPYLRFPFPCVVRTRNEDGLKFVRVNLFGWGHIEWGCDRLEKEDNVGVLLKTLFRTEDEACSAMK